MHQYEMDHYSRIREAAPECMVLLKSDGTFPLKEAGKIGLYGNGARHTLKGGTGSGDVYVRSYKSIEESLEEEGFVITTKDWLDGYDQAWKKAHDAFLAKGRKRIEEEGPLAILDLMGEVMPEPEYDLPLQKEDLSVYVLSRVCGEGSDRRDIKGDFRLTDSEVRDILTLAKQSEKFLLVLNTGGVVDLGPAAEEVNNILLLSMPGMSVSESFTDVLMGRKNPSGKLTATWASDYSFIHDFGEKDDTRYQEGIYSGYRGFEMFDQKKHFSFGYGLSYTTFQVKTGEVELTESLLTVKATVTNTGAYAGKEVVQVYASVPHTKMDHPLRELIGFAKTELLQPSETEEITIQANLSFLASYDDSRHVRFMEQGDYLIFAGTSLEGSSPIAIVHVPHEIILETTTLLERKPDFEDPAPVSREEWKTCFKDSSIQRLTLESIRKDPVVPVDPDTSFAQTFSDEQLAHICVGAYKGEGSKSVIGNAGFTVAGAAGQTTGLYEDLPSLVIADGPAGIRIARTYGLDEQGVYAIDQSVNQDLLAMVPEPIIHSLGLDQKPEERGGRHYTQYCSAIPVGTAMAQSFNRKLAEDMGDIVGTEMERFGIHLWLAPALNIQRHPLCGRTFEYYSEDPLISGIMAAAVTKGVQSHPGCGVVIKHYCANNQETNRFHSNSILSERTLRDLYLRGFEIAVKEGKPVSVMTSYNLLNGEHTSQREDLLLGILRNEWGYDGLIMSDWLSATGFPNLHKYPSACASLSIHAGNDVMMPGAPSDIENIMNGLQEGTITREDLVRCAARVIAVTQKLGKEHVELTRDEVEDE